MMMMMMMMMNCDAQEEWNDQWCQKQLNDQEYKNK
jgi:hypothetical protein